MRISPNSITENTDDESHFSQTLPNGIFETLSKQSLNLGRSSGSRFFSAKSRHASKFRMKTSII
jgi:hypothetical protein